MNYTYKAILLATVVAFGAAGCSEQQSSETADTAPAETAAPMESMVPEYVSMAVSDAMRPAEDTARDADRNPAEVVTFSGLEPSDKIAELAPGGGYYTRIFAKTVGADGKVYAVIAPSFLERRPNATDPINAMADSYGNVEAVLSEYTELATPEPVDMVWTSLNYHDFANGGEGNTAAVNAAALAALKPGGTYIVIDHNAEAGSGLRDTDTLHRIDGEAVKQEVLAAGFTLAGESDALDHPEDDHTQQVFAEGMRGKTDRFVLKFTKPAM